MARPRKDPQERRAAALPPVRLTEAELMDLAEQASASGLTLSDFVRQRLTTGRVVVPAIRRDAQLLAELNRVGVNLNQIAHRLNRGQGYPADLADALTALRNVLAVVGRAYGA
jgi:hypothetical protein